MGQPAHLEEQHHNQTFAMAPGSCAYRSLCVNTLVNPAEELDKLAGAQGLAKRSNAKSDEAFIKALTPPEASILPLVLPTSKDFFTKFIKVFMKMSQAQD